jgi:SWI/SNF-related matrix-associated actin-dependent regulator 1 of chromatin subfamily A
MFGNSFTMPGMAPAQSNAWRPTNNTPLAAQRSFGVSSGFQQGSHALNASGTRQTPVNGWNDHPQTQNGGYTQGTKRPRLDDHASKPQRPESPPSPDVQRPGQRRRPNLATDSSDDSFDAGSAGGRLSRGRPPTDAEQYSRFRLTQPGQPEARVKAAWTETKGDSRAASGLLLNESWQPKVAKPAPAPVSSPTRPTPAPAPTSQEETGRVKEVDDASQAARIAARERGKKSAIYQNRPVVDTVKPAPVTKPAAPAKRASPPPSPIIRGAGRKRAKKVIDSDSDEGYEASDDDGPQGRRAADDDDDDDVNEARALSYLNTAGPDAIQELTGPS